MKKKLFLLLGVLILISCEKEGELTRTSFGNVTINAGAVLKYTGMFSPTSNINASGNVKVYLDNNQYKLNLENVSITSGPDLKVYLSKTSSPNDFVNIGNFSNGNNLTYLIPGSVNLQDYPYVLVHCQQYNHLFAIAMLVPEN